VVQVVVVDFLQLLAQLEQELQVKEIMAEQVKVLRLMAVVEAVVLLL